MKTKTIVTITAVSSLGLAGALAYFLNSSASSTAVATLEPLPLAAPPEHTSTTVRHFTNVVRVDWNQVESDDYRKYIANLRAIGCPETTIRDIIIADVNKLFEARELALMGPRPKFEYWRREKREPVSDEKMKQRIELAREACDP